MPRWFAFTDTEDIIDLGSHDSFEGAAAAEEKLTHCCVWIFHEDTLRTLADKIDAALEKV